MLKIHPGFIAIAIMTGPAVLILGHAKVSENIHLSKPRDTEIFKVVKQVYYKCSEVPKLRRTVQCDNYITYFDDCVASKTQCSLRSSYEMLIKLDFTPPPLQSLPTNKVAIHRS